MAKYSKLLVTTLVALGCADRKTSETPSADASSSTGEPSDPTDASDTTSDLPSESSSSSSTPSESSSGEVVAECGNGVVEAPEPCDGEPGCVDCMRTCGFAEPIDLLLNDVSWTTMTREPVAVADGAGDIVVASLAGIHRVAPDGEEQWLNTEPTDTHVLLGLTASGPDHVWAGWTVSEESSFLARYTRHAIADGAEVDAFEVVGAPDTGAAALFGATDGSLYVATSVGMSETDWSSRVERRDARSNDVAWSTALSVEPGPDGSSFLVLGGLGLAKDGALFVGGYQRMDFDTREQVVAKLAADGSPVWQRNITTWSANWARAADPTPLDDGGVLIVAMRQYNNAGVIGNTPGHFTRLMRLDADGATMWEVDPTDEIAQDRVQVMTIHSIDDRFALGGALVDDTGNATPWLGYIDAQGELLCSTTVAHPDGNPASIDHFFTAADGSLMAQGYSDTHDADGSLAEGRWIASVYPY